ncbi:hypothetical protein ROTAS13_03142 [Roseomonas sp. TAS13]|uniref:hypothetical protein n=1 Tax=Roseomonas sp. TAS13 TaxID=1926319 RepID=UPI0009666981|nr:hypothetical protein [Roseomonas sp. TAS13]GAV35466.1 hypothetical protein ROTAS13_03142 [Roseomonas sp. TAS13]
MVQGGPQALSEVERRRLERLERTLKNRRGRRAPSVMPSRLARTSAFVPRQQNLSSDADFSRVYVVPPHSVVEVRGRELGTRHRDMLMACFRLRARRVEAVTVLGEKFVFCRTETSWRELLAASGLTSHVNNLLVALRILEELRTTTIRVFRGSYEDYQAASARGRLAGAGWSDALIGRIEWDGATLDAKLTVEYGEWVRRTLEERHLVSVDADTYFRLASDYARCWWPYIDSQPAHSWIGIETLATLAGKDYAELTTRQRVKLREEARQALDDMVRAGGLTSWVTEQIGSGRAKTYRYRYERAAGPQAELPV